MIVLRKKYVAWAGWAALAIILLTGATVGLAQVAEEDPVLLPIVTIETTPLKVNDPVYIEYDGVVGHDEDDFVGNFDVYDGNGEIVFSWTPYAFAAGVNGAYRISLLQLLNPLDEEQEWAERKVAHHHADANTPTAFTYGSFGFGEEICETCPTYIVVWAETYTYDELGAPVYSPIAGLYSPVALSTDASIQASEPFVIEILRPDPAKKESGTDDTGDTGSGGGGGGITCTGGAWDISAGTEVTPSTFTLNTGNVPNTCDCGGNALTGQEFRDGFCGGGPSENANGFCYCEVP